MRLDVGAESVADAPLSLGCPQILLGHASWRVVSERKRGRGRALRAGVGWGPGAGEGPCGSQGTGWGSQ